MSGVWGGWMRRLRRGQGEAPRKGDASGQTHELEDSDAGASAKGVTAEPGQESLQQTEHLDRNQTSPAAVGGDFDPDDDEVWEENEVRLEAADALPALHPPRIEPGTPSVPARQLLLRGELAACRAALRAGGDAELAPLVEALADGEAVLRSLGSGGEDGQTSVMLAPVQRSRGLLVVFGQDGGTFYLPPQPDNQVHTLYVRDEAQCLAMMGVPGLGEDYDACLLRILRIARTVGATDLFCLGGGAACYSALRYGLDLGAAGVLAAGALDHVRPGVQAPGLRPGTQGKRLMRLAAELGANLAEAYSGAATRPSLVLCRPGKAALAGLVVLPGTVSVDAPPGALAKILEWADQSGQLRGMVRDLLACRAVE